MKNKILFLIALITISFGCTQEPDIVFFASFRGNGEDGLHLSYSKDGYEWTTLNNDKTFLKPTVGESVLMRDPCVIYGPDRITSYNVCYTKLLRSIGRLRPVPPPGYH